MGRNTKENENMITKFKIFEKNLDIDPYGEEDWDDFFIENLWDIINNNKVFINKKFYETVDAIEFSLDYPHRGILDFLIEKDSETQKFTLYSVPYRERIRERTLNKETFEDLWDAIAYVVERI